MPLPPMINRVPSMLIVPNYEVLVGDQILEYINPKAKIHVLIIPKNPYVNFYDFTKNASLIEVESFWKLVNQVIEHTLVGEEGFRIITNSGKNGNQDVPHFHVHLLGGNNLGGMI